MCNIWDRVSTWFNLVVSTDVMPTVVSFLFKVILCCEKEGNYCVEQLGQSKKMAQTCSQEKKNRVVVCNPSFCKLHTLNLTEKVLHR